MGPAGSILSNLPDMAEWARFHLRGGVTSGGWRLVSEEALSAIYQPEMSNPTPMSERDLYRPQYPVGDVHVAYNLGWITNVYRGGSACRLTHQAPDKMDDILKMTFSNAFFNENLYIVTNFTKLCLWWPNSGPNQQRFRQWLGSEHATKHYITMTS